MDTFLELLSSIKIVGPVGIIAIVEGWVIYKLFFLYKDSLEKRLQDWETMNKDYQDLSNQINSTLDTVLKVFGRKNDNGSRDK